MRDSIRLATVGNNRKPKQEERVKKQKCLRVSTYLVSILTITLVLASSCAAQPTIPATEATTVEQTAGPTMTTPTRSANVPVYGGTFTFLRNSDMPGFDPLYTMPQVTQACIQVCDYLVRGDWTKGPAGSNDTDWANGCDWRLDLMKGAVAESWELPDNSTILVHLRKGVHFGLDPDSEASRLVNGREFTADDAVWSLARCYALPTTVFSMSYAVGQRPSSYTALDKYTVEIKTPPDYQGHNLYQTLAYSWLLPREVADKYGSFKDWHNLVGPGAFFLKDYVSNSSLVYERNPNYYEFDPTHPENRLPYVDRLKCLIINDTSTQLAAFRTGKVDVLTNVAWEDALSITKQNDNVNSRKTIVAPAIPWGRIDKQDLPFKDIRVRRALNMAVDKQEMIDDYYQGNAVMLGIPWPPSSTYSVIYTPLDQQPPEVQELFKYDPEKAKRLLAEGGYPNGFKAQILCDANDADYVSMISRYFSKINVDLDIKPLESGVYQSICRSRNYSEMILKAPVDYMNPMNLDMINPLRMDNTSYFTADWVQGYFDRLAPLYAKGGPELYSVLKESGPKQLAAAVGTYLPAPYKYAVWWSWLPNYHGELCVGYGGHNFMYRYLWVDSELKKSMGY